MHVCAAKLKSFILFYFVYIGTLSATYLVKMCFQDTKFDELSMKFADFIPSPVFNSELPSELVSFNKVSQ